MNIVTLQRVEHIAGEIAILQLPRRHVDRHRTGMQSHVHDLPEIGAGLFHDPAAHVHDQPGVFCELDEFSRRYEALLGMFPSHQRLSTPDLAVCQVELRLVINLQLLIIECRAQVALEFDLATALGVQLLAEELKPRAAGILGAIHRGIGVLQQGLHAVPIVGKHDDADTRAQEVVGASYQERFLEPLQYPGRGHAQRIAGSVFRHDDDELVAAKTRNGIAFAHFANDAFCGLCQDHVSDRVTEHVVDFLEPVEIEIKDCPVRIVSPCVNEL